MPGKVRDRVGERHGRWVVLEFDRVVPGSGARFICKCDCGTVRSVQASSLRNGVSRSCGCLQKLPEGEASRNSIFRIYRRGAEKRGLVFEVTLEEFARLTQCDCHYCGAAPSADHHNPARHYNGSYVYNGLDRIDNTQGYTSGNCVPCCAACNRMKGVMGYEEFIEQSRRIARHQT